MKSSLKLDQTIFGLLADSTQKGLSQLNKEDIYQKILNLLPETLRDQQPKINLFDRVINSLYNVAKELEQNHRNIDAEIYYQEILKLEPSSFLAHFNLGKICKQKEQLQQAYDHFHEALKYQPDEAKTGSALKSWSTFDLNNDNSSLYYSLNLNLGLTAYCLGKQEEAIEFYGKAIEQSPDAILPKFTHCIAQIPIIYRDQEQLIESRNSYTISLKNLLETCRQNQFKVENKFAFCGEIQPFYLAYQGLNDRDLQENYGTIVHKIVSTQYPQWSIKKDLPKLKAGEKIRIGFVSGFFYYHSVWKILLQGWVENLDRSEFELFGYHTGNKRDQETDRAAKAFDKFEGDDLSFSQWAQKIAQDNLHILIFPEFGMHPLVLQLGCLRLAPVQISSWGHPETSGLPTIDYFLTSDLMETPQGQEHYKEKIIRLPNLGICYKLILIQPEAIRKRDLGIRDESIMFWCCQSLFKYLPQNDDVFPRIAQELDNCKFVFIKHQSEFTTEIFCQRLKAAFAKFNLNYQDYCVFLPRLTPKAFSGTTAIADIYLDNIGWSGGNTTIESTAYDLPIVTLPGELMRSRHTMAMLKMMGIEETIAQNKDEYVQIAVRLGQDANYRQEISRKIALNKHKLYEDFQPVRVLEDFLLKIVNKRRRFNNSQVAETFQLAVQYHQANRLEAAQQEYLKVLAVQPDHAEALYGLGAIAQQNGKLAEAEQYLTVSVKAEPKFVKAWFSLGNLCQSQDQFFAAEQAYRQALKLRPDSVPICNNLGYVLQQQDKWEEAASYYKKALELEPNCTEADVNWGNALYAQGKLSPDEVSHYAGLNYKLGLGRHQVQDFSTAVLYYQQAISMQSELVDAHYYLGLVLQKQRKLAEALSCYQEVLRLNSNFGAVYYNLGQIYQDQGDLNQASANFQQGLKLINPNYAQVRESHQNAPTLAENFTIPEIPQGEVMIGKHKFPAIPIVSESEVPRPFWSVVIPVVNRPEYFPETLTSVLAQWTNTEEMEIIVLDNGSEPAQWKIPDDLGKGIIRYYRFPKTVSLQENWNTAIALCRGHWIHLLHHDDYVLPGFYARLQASLETCPESVGAAFTGYENIDEERNIILYQQHNLENYRGIVRDWIKRIGACCPLSPPSVVIRRVAYERLGGYKLDLPYTCDWEFYKRVATFYDWWYEPGVLVHYRQHTNSITIAENINGSSGMAFLRAIEISESYLPAEYRAEITAQARVHYFHWCLAQAKIPLKVGNLDGASQLIQTALKMCNSPEAREKVNALLNTIEAKPIRERIALTST